MYISGVARPTDGEHDRAPKNAPRPYADKRDIDGPFTQAGLHPVGPYEAIGWVAVEGESAHPVHRLRCGSRRIAMLRYYLLHPA